MSKTNASSGNALICCVLSSVIVLAIQLVSWACAKPNTSMEFCVAITQPCSIDNNDQNACNKYHTTVRNQFPILPDESNPTGTVMDKQMNCWQTQSCSYDPDLNR